MEFLGAPKLTRPKLFEGESLLRPHPIGVSPPAAPPPGLFSLLENFLASSPIGFSYFDEDLRYVCVNHPFAAMVGYAPDQLLGQLPRDASPESALSWEPALRRVFDTGISEMNIEFPLPRHDATSQSQVASANLYPVLGDKGEVVGVGVMLVDVTERKALEARLFENEERLRLALESAALGTWDWNVASGVILLSARAQAICGTDLGPSTPLEVFFDSVHPEDRAGLKEAIRRALETPGEDYRSEYRSIGSKDGKERWVGVRGRVKFDQEKRPVLFTGVVSDATLQKQADQLRQKVSVELMRSNSELERFASVASHDLREPVRTVSNYVSLLRRRNKETWDPVSLEFLAFAESGARRMGELIDDLLFYSRVSNEQREKQECDLNVILQKTLLNLGAAIEESRAQITSDRLPAVMGESSYLIQLFQNLLANSIKYRRQGEVPRIHISATRAEAEWLILFKDEGIGFEEKEASNIFEAFVRLHGHADYSGSGLGLATCRKIVTQHGGQIWAESKLGKGASFFFTIPALKE